MAAADHPVAAVRRYIDGFNRGDAAAMADAFADPGFILDGMAPHVWAGPTATQDWWRDVLKEAERHGASDYMVTVGEPAHADVSGASAYVVVPAAMSFKVRGRPVTQSGSTFTVALRRSPDRWRIAAWAWTKGGSSAPEAVSASRAADDPAGAVRRFVDAFNALDVEAIAARFSPQGFILDGLAPHLWAGRSAARDWCRDALAEAERAGDFRIELGAPLHDVVTGDAAYFAAPATMTSKAGGRPVAQTDARATLALRKVDGRWLICAWAWTKGAGVGGAARP